MKPSPRPIEARIPASYDGEQLIDIKKELTDIRNSLWPFDLNEADTLCTSQATLEKMVFDCSLQIKKLLHQLTDASSLTYDGKGVKLPKLEVPTFDGNILNWRSFWEQFCVSVHDRSSLSDPEKLNIP